MVTGPARLPAMVARLDPVAAEVDAIEIAAPD
jgi:hypothetical protein